MNELSLYAVEFCSDGDFEGVFSAHSFFALVDESGDRPKILEELHFWRSQDREEPDKWRIVSQRRADKDKPRPIDNRLAMRQYASGDGDTIRGDWERACDHAKTFDNLEVDNSDPMSPKTHDCRAGVRTIINFLGFEYAHVVKVPGTASGSEADLNELIPQ